MISCQKEFDRVIDSLPVGAVINKYDMVSELNGKFWTMAKIEHYLCASKKLVKVGRRNLRIGGFTEYEVLPRSGA